MDTASVTWCRPSKHTMLGSSARTGSSTEGGPAAAASSAASPGSSAAGSASPRSARSSSASTPCSPSSCDLAARARWHARLVRAGADPLLAHGGAAADAGRAEPVGVHPAVVETWHDGWERGEGVRRGSGQVDQVGFRSFVFRCLVRRSDEKFAFSPE